VRRLVVAAVVALGLASAAPAAAPAARPALAAKSCSSRFVHAVIGGQEKCLHAGEFCAARYRSQHPRYGFRCVAGRLRS
jgi:hypothetical protein